MALKNKRVNLHGDIKYILKISQIFGLFPVSNILSEDYSIVQFKWMSPLTLYALLITCGTLMFTTITFVLLCTLEFKMHLLDLFVFSVTSSATSLTMFKISKDWPELLAVFCKTEVSFGNYNYHENLRKRFIVIFVIFTGGIFIEHGLAIANTIYGIDSQLLITSNSTLLDIYFQRDFAFVFYCVEYSKPVGFISLIIRSCNVFAWSFTDSFIMMMSSSLASKFKKICLQIESGVDKKYTSILFWTKVREDYNHTSYLCYQVNEKIGYMIMVSFGRNMYVVLTQLYKGLTIKRMMVDQFYFLFSFGFVIVKLVGVILHGAAVHVQSKKPLSYLMSLPSAFYNEEIERFIMQIHCQNNSLSGNQFFEVTRGLIFGMTTTIITYELFMLQTNIQ